MIGMNRCEGGLRNDMIIFCSFLVDLKWFYVVFILIEFVKLKKPIAILEKVSKQQKLIVLPISENHNSVCCTPL